MALSFKIAEAFTQFSTRGVERVEAATGRIHKRLEAMQSVVGGPLRLLFGLGGAAGAAGLIKLASDAEEMNSKFKTVFKEQSAAVSEWADTLGKSIGRSANTLRQFAAQLQDTFVPLGFARDSAAEMSKAVTELAVDLASFNNLAEPDVINNLTSALVGNHMAVRRFGIILSETALNQELLNMGIEGGLRAATDQQKVMARLAIIVRSSGDAVGDAARTSDSFANRMRALRAQATRLAVSFGNLILPAASKMVGLFTGLVEILNDTGPGLKRALIGFVALGGAVLFLIPAIMRLRRTVIALHASLLALKNPLAALAVVAGAIFVGWAADAALAATETDHVAAALADAEDAAKSMEERLKDVFADAASGAGAFAGELENVQRRMQDVLDGVQKIGDRIHEMQFRDPQGVGGDIAKQRRAIEEEIALEQQRAAQGRDQRGERLRPDLQAVRAAERALEDLHEDFSLLADAESKLSEAGRADITKERIRIAGEIEAAEKRLEAARAAAQATAHDLVAEEAASEERLEALRNALARLDVLDEHRKKLEALIAAEERATQRRAAAAAALDKQLVRFISVQTRIGSAAKNIRDKLLDVVDPRRFKPSAELEKAREEARRLHGQAKMDAERRIELLEQAERLLHEQQLAPRGERLAVADLADRIQSAALDNPGDEAFRRKVQGVLGRMEKDGIKIKDLDKLKQPATVAQG